MKTDPFDDNLKSCLFPAHRRHFPCPSLTRRVSSSSLRSPPLLSLLLCAASRELPETFFFLLRAVDMDHERITPLDGLFGGAALGVGNAAGRSQRGPRQVVNLAEVIEGFLAMEIVPAVLLRLFRPGSGVIGAIQLSIVQRLIRQ